MSADELTALDIDAEGIALPSSRVPHLGHALLFLAIAGLLLLLSQGVLLLPKLKPRAAVQTVAAEHPKLVLATEAGTYLATLAIAWFVFPLLWRRSFPAGIDWNGAQARAFAWRLIPLGICAGWVVQGVSSLISMPKTVPMDDFFRSQTDVWIVTLFGTFLAPVFEEVCFRGFLLPAAAIACDWLGSTARYSLARMRGGQPATGAAIFREDAAAGLAPDTGNLAFRSRWAVIVASLLTSALFATLHAEQLGYTWAAVGLLAGVSLVLTAVRIRTRSVACSALVHGSYNFSVFLTLFMATGGYRHLDRMAR